MQSETLAQEFARLVKEYHEGDDHTKPEAWNLLADYAVDNADAISAALSKPVANSTCGRRIERETNDGDAKNASSARDIYDPVGVEAHAENERSDDYGLRQPAHSDRSRREGTPLAALSDQERAVEVKIKPLEWKETCGDSGRYATAITKLGSYDAFELSLNVRGGPRTLFGWTGHWMNGDQKADSFEAAKAAAQADYEQRIRSALVDVPVEPVIPTANCCVCGRIIDTREKSEGGDDFGDETEPGKWTCSVQCYDTYVGFVPHEPPPHREGEDSAEVLRSALQRISELTPAKANAKDARDLHHTVKAIADVALAATRSASASTATGGDHE